MLPYLCDNLPRRDDLCFKLRKLVKERSIELGENLAVLSSHVTMGCVIISLQGGEGRARHISTSLSFTWPLSELEEDLKVEGMNFIVVKIRL